MRAIRVATVVGALTLAIAACGDDDGAAETEPVAAAQGQDSEDESSQEKPDSGNRKVVFEPTGAAVPTVLTANCNPTDAADCILPNNFPPTDVTGDLRGTAFSSGAVIGRNGLFPGVALVAFFGEVEGCGTGGLLVTSVGTFDQSTGLTTGEWTINEDGGTGDLADVTGSGTSVYDAEGGRYEGRIRCR
jgi:hypothetical protein